MERFYEFLGVVYDLNSIKQIGTPRINISKWFSWYTFLILCQKYLCSLRSLSFIGDFFGTPWFLNMTFSPISSLADCSPKYYQTIQLLPIHRCTDLQILHIKYISNRFLLYRV